MLIRWTGPAARDLTHVCHYIEERSSAAAARQVAVSIYQGIGISADFAEMGWPGRRHGTRELVFNGLPYVPVYRVPRIVSKSFASFHGAQKRP